jgi:hypothetical protein
MDAVAPVMSKEGGCGEQETEERRSGRAFWEKLYRPNLALNIISFRLSGLVMSASDR